MREPPSVAASRQHNTVLTSSWDLLTSAEYSFTVATSLVACRSKKPCEQEATERDGRLPAPGSAPGALQDCGAVRPKANNVPTTRVHILCGSAAFPQSPSQRFRAEKDSRYTRAGGLLCVAVIHGRQYGRSFGWVKHSVWTLDILLVAADPAKAFQCKDHLRV